MSLVDLFHLGGLLVVFTCAIPQFLSLPVEFYLSVCVCIRMCDVLLYSHRKKLCFYHCNLVHPLPRLTICACVPYNDRLLFILTYTPYRVVGEVVCVCVCVCVCLCVHRNVLPQGHGGGRGGGERVYNGYPQMVAQRWAW